MATRYIPLFLKHSPTPRVENFALLSGLEAAVRGTLISAMPLAVYDALGSAEATSAIYFIAGLVSLTWGLFVPWGTRFIPRRWMYTLGCGLYILGLGLGILGTTWSLPLALMTLAMATATTFVCLNAYVLDYIDRGNLGRSQSMQMVFAAGPWAVGPLFGVWLRHLWAPLPFIVAACFVVALLSVFWILRLGNGKQITRAKGPATNPLAYLGRFFAQPRLIAGWSFAVIRSCGWWVYVVYLPIYHQRALVRLAHGAAVGAPIECASRSPAFLCGMHGGLYLCGGVLAPAMADGDVLHGGFGVVGDAGCRGGVALPDGRQTQ